MNELLAAADRNMLRYWAALLACAPKPGRVDGDGVVMLSSGLRVPLFNPAYVNGAVDDPARVVQTVVDHYDELDSPFALYFRDEVTPGLADACGAAGLVEHYRVPLMVWEDVPEPGPAPDGVEINTVNAENLDEYVGTMAAAFHIPAELLGSVMNEGLLEADGFTGYLARVDGEAAATSGVFLSDGVAGVYNVSTAEGHRGRGIGAAVTWRAAAAGRSGGATTSILQSSKEGHSVYTGMGYVTPARYRQFERSEA